MAKRSTTRVTMTGRRSCGGVPYGPGETPDLPSAFAEHWIGLGVAVAYVEPEIEAAPVAEPEIAAETPETAPPVAIEPEQAAEAAPKAKT